MQSKCWQDISDQCAEKEKDCFHCFAVLSSLQTYMKFFIHKIQRMNEKFYRSSSWLFFPKRQCGGDQYQTIHKIGVVHSRPAGNGGVAAVGADQKGRFSEEHRRCEVGGFPQRALQSSHLRCKKICPVTETSLYSFPSPFSNLPEHLQKQRYPLHLPLPAQGQLPSRHFLLHRYCAQPPK